MRPQDRTLCKVLIVAALALIVPSCVGSNGTLSLSSLPTAQRKAPRPGILPEAKSEALLYAASEPSSVYVFSYPAGKRVGTLTGFVNPRGLCVDDKGDVWVTNFSTGDIVEYAHGGSTPITTLNADVGGPLGCSVDPTSGNLAVSYQNGAVSIWRDASGSPTTYSFAYELGYCGYDGAGNLFVDSAFDQNALLELPVGSASFHNVKLNKKISSYGGQVQWDGKYITVEELHRPGAIYRIAVTGDTGKIVGTTTFMGLPRQVAASWIQGKKVLIPYGTKRDSLIDIGVWHYPAGGARLRHTRDSQASIRAVVVSE